jgi:hypothetical protein
MMRSSRRLIGAFAVGAFAAFSSAGAAGAGEQLTKKEFRAQANQFCETASVALGVVFNDAFADLPEGQALPQAALEAAIATALPIFRQSLDAVEGLEGPEAFEKKVDKMLDQYRAAADEIEDDPQLAFVDDDAIWTKPDKAAKKLGLEDCVQG